MPTVRFTLNGRDGSVAYDEGMSLLAVLRHLQTYAPVRFDLGVITVDPEIEGFDPSSLCSSLRLFLTPASPIFSREAA